MVDCRACRYAADTVTGLWCVLRKFPALPRGCMCFEREAGADLE